MSIDNIEELQNYRPVKPKEFDKHFKVIKGNTDWSSQSHVFFEYEGKLKVYIT